MAGKIKKIKNQFVLVVGDDGAILCHYLENRLSSRIFVDSPLSEDVKLFAKLLSSYPNHPVTILVDVIEQNYIQQVLPPVSSIGLVSQIERRMKRDLRAEDLNNFLISGRQKDGRKDWNVLFISLANVDPFSKWMELILKQTNKFDGVYLLPVESVKLMEEMRKQYSSPDHPNAEWEILLFHNKTGGFRIVAFKSGQLVFARLAQNLIGESIPEVVVGNLEQEIQNTFEYLKRLGFRGDVTSKITIVAAAEILEKVDTKVLKFNEINLFSPYQIAGFTSLPDTVGVKDKYADIFLASYFASQKKHELKFQSAYTRKLDRLYTATKAMFVALIVVCCAGVYREITQVMEVMKVYDQIEVVQNDLKLQSRSLSEGKMVLDKESTDDTSKIVSIYNLYMLLPQEKYRLLKILSKLATDFGDTMEVTSIAYTSGDGPSKPVEAGPVAADNKAPKTIKLEQEKIEAENYEVRIGLDFILPENKTDKVGEIGQVYLTKIKAYWPTANISYSKPPQSKQQEAEFEVMAAEIDNKVAPNTRIPAEIKITFGKAAAATPGGRP